MTCETEGRDTPKYRANSFQNFPHQIPKGSITCADKQMDMVRHQHPCITSAASQRKILFKSTKKVIPVAVVKKDILAIQTPGDDMMNRTGDIESSVSRHATMIATRQINVN
jgi:hypothetical protein